MVLVIDGSYGEGGGQILRTAVSLSMVTNTPVTITNIRANRPNPGIKPQHYAALSIMKTISQAETDGLEIGSSRFSFSPGDFTNGSFRFDEGTAGSIVLVFQTCLLCALRATQPITITLRGGTDVKWAPSWDYFTKVFLQVLRQCGLQIDARLVKMGYYPKGGGEAVLTIHPCSLLRSFVSDEPACYELVQGIVRCGNLPDHVGKRLKHAAIKTLVKNHLRADIQYVFQKTLSAGAGITLWALSDMARVGCSVLGERGVPAEKVAVAAVDALLQDVRVGATADEHLFDQLLPYFVLAKGSSTCFVRRISSHAETNMWLLQQFFPDRHLFSKKKIGDVYQVTVDGVG